MSAAAGDILNALRGASCPYSALHFYSLLRLRLRSSDPSYFAWRAAVFTLKPLSAASSLPLLSHFHGHLVRSNLLAYPHVASSLLRSYSLLSPSAAHQLFDQIPSTTSNIYILNIMLASLCRSSDLETARAFFGGIPDKDVVSWSTMLSCCFSNGHLTDGLAFFRRMTFTTDIAVDCAMLATLLTSCASAEFLPLFCKAIHGYAVRHSIPVRMHLGAALIDCYAKTNRIDCATCVFARMTKRNVVHWTIMIRGMGSQLRNIEAVQLFEEMCQRRVQPNEMTFTAVLSACVNAGLVEKGRDLFKLMVDRYHLEPNIHHYGCMVDLYAKAGLLEDAYEVIKTMKVEPNIIIWTSLLVACKNVKNFEIAFEGIEKVLALEITDENIGLYNLISDLYAMGGRWDDVLKIRRLMEERDGWKNSSGQTTLAYSNPRPGIVIYSDASITPNIPGQASRKAGIGIVIINTQVQPVLTIHIKAIMQDVSSVLMAEAGALALAAVIAANPNYTKASFLTDNRQLVQFLSSTDHTHPPDWRMKLYTQHVDNCAAIIQSTLHKINRTDNVVADYLARQAYSVAETLHQPCHMHCSYGAHLSQCPLRQALLSVAMNDVWLLAASCC